MEKRREACTNSGRRREEDVDEERPRRRWCSGLLHRKDRPRIIFIAEGGNRTAMGKLVRCSIVHEGCTVADDGFHAGKRLAPIAVRVIGSHRIPFLLWGRYSFSVIFASEEPVSKLCSGHQAAVDPANNLLRRILSIPFSTEDSSRSGRVFNLEELRQRVIVLPSRGLRMRATLPEIRLRSAHTRCYFYVCPLDPIRSEFQGTTDAFVRA